MLSDKEITVTVAAGVYTLLEKEAKKENKDLSEMIYEIIKAYLDKRNLEENINKNVFSFD